MKEIILKSVTALLFVFLLVVNSFSQWVEQVSNTTQFLFSISVPDENVAWAAGVGGAVVKTTNGGTNWIDVSLPSGKEIFTIFALDANLAVCSGTNVFSGSGDSSYVYRTSNGGLNWSLVFVQPGGFLDGIIMFDALNGFMNGDPVGGRWSLFKTIDGGITWDSTGMYLVQDGSENGWNNGIYNIGSTVWFGTNNSRIYKSSDLINWEIQPTPGTVFSSNVVFSNPLRGYTNGSSTTNGGTNWVPFSSPDTNLIISIAGHNDFVWALTGNFNTLFLPNIYYSTNGGSSFVLQYTSPSGNNFQIVRARTVASHLVLYVIRDNGSIARYSDNPLPIELASFTSIVNRRDVTLNWTTASERNNSGFDIERSIANPEVSGQVDQWSKVGFVQGNGTTSSPNSYSFVDRGLNSGKYNYRLKQVDFNGNFEYFSLSNGVGIGIPNKFDLSQNYPNPFNPSTKFNYDIPFDGKVSLKLFDMSGREVATLVNEVQAAGYYTVNFNASSLASGVYFYTISAQANGNNFVETKKMMLVK